MSILTLTKENFREEVLECAQAILSDFWASRYGPCRTVSPLIHEIAEEIPSVKIRSIRAEGQQQGKVVPSI